MAYPADPRVYRVTGRLYWNVDPSDLEDADTNYGGIPLGRCNRIAIRPGFDHSDQPSEEFARAIESIHLERDFEMGFTLRDWDSETLAALLPNTTVGAVSGERVIRLPGSTVVVGQKMAALMAKPLLFAADREGEHPSFLLYNALPLYDTEEALNLSFQRELQTRMFFRALPDTSVSPWRVADIGRVADLEGL